MLVSPRLVLLLLLLPALALAAQTEDVQQENQGDSVSTCLKSCLRSIASLEKSFGYVFRNYDSVCEALETGAACAQKCGYDDQRRYNQYTTFYRLYCVDFEEELEDEIPCLRMTAEDADSVCRHRCTPKPQGTDAPKMGKSERMRVACEAMECSTHCYFEEFSTRCPTVRDTLFRLNLRQLREMRDTTSEKTLHALEGACRRLHDEQHMSQLLQRSIDR